MESDTRNSAVEELNQANRFIEVSDGCSTKHTPPPPQLSPSEKSQVELMMHRLIDMMQRLMLGQRENNEKICRTYEELYGAFDYLFATVKRLEVQVTQYDEKVEQLLILWSGNNKYWNRSLTETPANDPPPATKEIQGNVQSQFHEDKRETPPLKSLQKKGDPGQFVVPCSINGIDFKDSMCDSGSSINLMPREVAARLGFTNLQPSKITLAFADSSTTVPVGMIADLDVRVGDCLVPTDFQVIEMSRENEVPLILGRPFMATAGAIMDLPKNQISFSNINSKVFYDILSRPEPTKYASCVWVVKKKEKPPPPPASKRPPRGKPVRNLTLQRSDTPWRSSQHFARISIPIPDELRSLEKAEITEKLKATLDQFPDIRSWEIKGTMMVARTQRRQSFHAKFSGVEGEGPAAAPSQS